MGYDLPAALGAQCACHDRLVPNINGDGSFQQTMQALITAAEANLPIKVIIVNNQGLGMVRQWQDLFYDRRFMSVELKNPDFAALGDALGAVSFTARHPGELDDAYEQALAVTDRPALVNVICSPTENCYPMWPAGLAIDSMVIEDPKHLERSTA